MSSSPKLDEALKQAILQKTDSVLNDQDVMHALIAGNDRSMGGNIVDLRGIAMDRLESRLDRLEDTHRSVIAAAYENLAGTNQVHRAILRMMDPMEFEGFLRDLGSDVAEILRVDSITLVLETPQTEKDAVVRQLGSVLCMAEEGFVEQYLAQGRAGEPRQVTLRQVQVGTARIYGEKASWIRSEACLKLDLGAGRLPGMLVMGAEDPHQFTPQHGTDLLAFFAGVFERSMRHWLS